MSLTLTHVVVVVVAVGVALASNSTDTTTTEPTATTGPPTSTLAPGADSSMWESSSGSGECNSYGDFPLVEIFFLVSIIVSGVTAMIVACWRIVDCCKAINRSRERKKRIKSGVRLAEGSTSATSTTSDALNSTSLSTSGGRCKKTCKCFPEPDFVFCVAIAGLVTLLCFMVGSFLYFWDFWCVSETPTSRRRLFLGVGFVALTLGMVSNEAFTKLADGTIKAQKKQEEVSDAGVNSAKEALKKWYRRYADRTLRHQGWTVEDFLDTLASLTHDQRDTYLDVAKIFYKTYAGSGSVDASEVDSVLCGRLFDLVQEYCEANAKAGITFELSSEGWILYLSKFCWSALTGLPLYGLVAHISPGTEEEAPLYVLYPIYVGLIQLTAGVVHAYIHRDVDPESSRQDKVRSHHLLYLAEGEAREAGRRDAVNGLPAVADRVAVIAEDATDGLVRENDLPVGELESSPLSPSAFEQSRSLGLPAGPISGGFSGSSLGFSSLKDWRGKIEKSSTLIDVRDDPYADDARNGWKVAQSAEPASVDFGDPEVFTTWEDGGVTVSFPVSLHVGQVIPIRLSGSEHRFQWVRSIADKRNTGARFGCCTSGKRWVLLSPPKVGDDVDVVVTVEADGGTRDLLFNAVRVHRLEDTHVVLEVINPNNVLDYVNATPDDPAVGQVKLSDRFGNRSKVFKPTSSIKLTVKIINYGRNSSWEERIGEWTADVAYNGTKFDLPIKEFGYYTVCLEECPSENVRYFVGRDHTYVNYWNSNNALGLERGASRATSLVPSGSGSGADGVDNEADNLYQTGTPAWHDLDDVPLAPLDPVDTPCRPESGDGSAGSGSSSSSLPTCSGD